MTEMSTIGTPIMMQKYLLDLMPTLQIPITVHWPKTYNDLYWPMTYSKYMNQFIELYIG